MGAAASFNTPRGIDIHPTTGDIYVADSQNHRIRKVTDGKKIPPDEQKSEKVILSSLVKLLLETEMRPLVTFGCCNTYNQLTTVYSRSSEHCCGY